MEGTVRTLKIDKGFGFITGSDGVEYFVHRSGMERTTERFDELREGQRVAFTPIAGEKGPRAIEVRTL